MDYSDFLRAKVVMAEPLGFDIDDSEINPILKPHQRAIVKWAVRGGRRAIFAAFGLGKSVIQIEIVRIVRQHAGGMGLIVIPLGVRQEFTRDAAMLGVTVKFIRRIEEADDPNGIYLTNYETVRDEKIDPRMFTVASLDEASALRGFGGTKTFRAFMALFAGDDRRDMSNRIVGNEIRYRFVATATPSPNDYIELLAYSAFLGIMDVSAAKTRFFKRNSEKADQLTIHPHKQTEFWMWVASWGIFVQKPSDLCECSCHKEKNYPVNGSGNSSSNHGNQAHCGTAHGSVGATAAAHISHDQAICCEGSSSAAGVFDQSTAEKGNASIPYGAACSTDATGTVTKTGKTTAGEELSFASSGTDSLSSPLTWGSRQPEQQSNESTTQGTTNRETAAGTVEKPKHETPGALSASPSMGELNLSQHGLKNSTPTTGHSSGDTSAAGHRSACSKTYCDRCRCDEGYELPELDIRWHEIPADHADAGHEAYGQARMFKNQAIGVVDAAREKRDSLPARVAKMMELRAEAPDAHRLLWHDLEAERHAIEKAVPGVKTVYGSQELEDREQAIIDFSNGLLPELAGKPSIMGSGCNFQRHCSWAIFLGIGFKFNDFIQAIYRLQRFLQKNRVRIDLIYTEAEREVRRQLERKWKQDIELREKMAELIKEYGLSHAAMAQHLTRAMGVKRVEVAGQNYRCINNDSVQETAGMEENSVGLIVTSIPFSTQYEYSPNYADFGHTDNNEHFFRQMDFLTPNLLRVLQPGRLAAIHVKDRIVPGGMTGLGFQTVYPFHARCIEHYTKHGFAYMGMKTIVTDVVRENNQTYRLGWTEQCKDGSKMGVGMPEYLLIFRKPPTSNEKSYADLPVVKDKAQYTRGRWQVDAHGFARSSGNRQLRPEELIGLPHDQIFKMFKENSLSSVYDFEHHVRIAETLDAHGKLPVTFMLLQPQSWSDEVWTDVTRMLTLNGAQSAKGKEMHLCPMQFDIADRAIEQWSMPGETVLDPFGGLMTVPYRAVLKGRKGVGIELNPAYFLDGAAYCKAAEQEMSMPSLFDFTELEAAA